MKIIITILAIYCGYLIGVLTSSRAAKNEISKRLEGKTLITEESLKIHDEMLQLVTLADVKAKLDEEVEIFEDCATMPTIWSAYAAINQMEKTIKEEVHDASGQSFEG